MARGNVEGIRVGAAAEDGTDRVLLVEQRNPGSFLGWEIAVSPDQTGFGNTDGRQIQNQAEMASNAESPGMGDALTITQDKVRGDSELLQGVQNRWDFAKRE